MTKPEFFTYLYLYAAAIDTEISPEELAFIQDKVGANTFQKMKSAFDSSNELEKTERIVTNARRLGIDKNTIQTELSAIGLADGTLSGNETYLIRMLGRLVN